MAEFPVADVVLQPLLSTTGNGFSHDVAAIGREAAVFITWSAGVTAGVVTVEASDDATFTGVWAQIAVVPWVSASRKDKVDVTGCQRFVRARISTNIVDGTISARLYAN